MQTRHGGSVIQVVKGSLIISFKVIRDGDCSRCVQTYASFSRFAIANLEARGGCLLLGGGDRGGCSSMTLLSSAEHQCLVDATGDR